MKEYIVRYGQNLMDVCVACYGSIEGLKDMLSLNPDLNLGSDIKIGDKIKYDPSKAINQTALNFYYRYSIIPNTGSKEVVFKVLKEGMKPALTIKIDKDIINFAIKLGQLPIGVLNAEIQIDWGDNSPLQDIVIKSEAEIIYHTMNSSTEEDRKIIIYSK